MGTQLHKHSKCQMEQVNKFTEAVTKMTSSHNANKLAARSIADPENSDNSDSREDDEVNDGRNRVTMKQIVTFTIKPTWQLPFCLIRRPHHFQ